MTITTQPARNEYTATPGQTVFNYTFKIYDTGDLDVYITPIGQEPDDAADLTTAYVIDPGTIGDEDGGFLTLNTPLSGGQAVTIVSGIDYDRTVDYQNNGDFLPNTVNGDNDRQVSQIKQLLDTFGRTISFPASAQGAQQLTYPSGDRSETLLAFDENGDPAFLPASAVTKPIQISTEQVVISAGQTVVNFTTLSTEETGIYICGLDVDQGRLCDGEDYNVTGENQITLTESYPDGSIILVVQNDPTGVNIAAADPIPGDGINLLINGSFAYFQRGDNFVAPSAYTADRWYGIGGNRTYLKSTDVPDDLTEFSLQCDAGASASPDITQPIELPAAGVAGVFKADEKFTLSLWAKSDTNTNLLLGLEFADNAQGTNGVEVLPPSTIIDVLAAGVWQKVEYTFTVGTQPVGTNLAFNVKLLFSSQNSSGNFAQVQLERGETASPFQFRNAAQEEDLIERYYQVIPARNSFPFATGYAALATEVRCELPLIRPMRAIPFLNNVDDLIVTGQGSSEVINSGLLQSNEIPRASVPYSFSVTGPLTTNQIYTVSATTDRVLAFEAEL